MSTKVIDFEKILANLRLATNQPTALQRQHLSWTKQRARPYDGNWQTPWLLCDWHAKQWQTIAGVKTRQKHGKWIGTADVDWDVILPDGTKLTDTRYATMLETCRRVSFLYRQGYADGKPPSVESWKSFNNHLLNLCQWLVLEHSRYHPDKFGLSLLDQTGIKRLLRSVARGGWCEALALVERSLNGLHQAVFKQPCPASLLAEPDKWPEATRQAVITWLEEQQGYSFCSTALKKNTGITSRVLLSELASAPINALKNNQRFNSVLRQFEPKLAHTSLLLAQSQGTEYPSQNTPILQDVLKSSASKSMVDGVGKMLRLLLMLYRHQSKRLPSPTSINLTEAQASAYNIAVTDNHTPFIPVDTGLHYLNHALRWVLLYGDDLVDYYLAVMRPLCSAANASKALSPWNKVINFDLPQVLCKTPLPTVLKQAGFAFKKLGTQKGPVARDFERKRRQPTLHEALEIYIGAVTVLIALMKPSRDSEIVNLPRVCLLRTRDGHYWLDSDLAKRTKGERRTRTGGKPIPVITARAIQQVRKLNRNLVKIFGEDDTYLRGKLFYLPNPNKWGTGKEIDSGSLNSYLDKFCDYVGLPPDVHGRRWYLRIHQMRKWFLLLLFWSGRYDVLDAARWIAGHTDVDLLYAYIEREFPGGKIGQLEAECAIDRLAEYDTTKVTVDGEGEGLVELYQRVLRQFRVKALNMVPEREWQALVEDLFEHDYHLAPYSITTDDGHKRLCIAIRQGGREED